MPALAFLVENSPHRELLAVLAIFSAAAAISSCGYYCFCLLSAGQFLRSKPDPPANFTPPVSILKPLKGTDPEMYESFRSHCLQDYPQYEIVFGVSGRDDPAIAVVEQLRREFPQLPIRLVIAEKRLGLNGKVSALAQMVKEAHYDHLIVNDSDIRVERDYLRSVFAPLSDPEVGLVTCLYRGVPAASLGSWLESLGISTDFSAGVLAAWLLEGGLHFGLGCTLAFRRADLQSIGGFEAIADYLADDYELGRRTSEQGGKVKLSTTVVETFLPPYSFAGFFRHQLRWARTIRNARPAGYAGLAATFGLLWAVAAFLCLPRVHLLWGLLGITALLRLATALVVGRLVLHDESVVRGLLLLPLRDVMGVCVWLAGFAGRTVEWRGEEFNLENGKLLPTRNHKPLSS